MKRLLISALVFCAAAANIQDTIDLGYSKYKGVSLTNGITQWQGIRYAAPPIGNLRFAPPQDPEYVAEVQLADTKRKYCLETGASASSTATSEDCLFLNVQTPSNATSTSKLPVYLFIQGGGFNKNSNPNINASGLIAASGYGIVVVDLNYRVGPYGFLSDGDKVTPNVGLLDQRKVFKWVQSHISKFGGDPGHVVLGGISAGAESIALHLTANNATDEGFFHAAAAESPSFATTLTVSEAQYLYRNFATRLGCAGADSLACMRNKTTAELQVQNFNIAYPGASNPPNYLWTPIIDGTLVPDYQYKMFRSGKFIKVPTIYGDDANGGTIFTPKNTTTLAQSNQYILDSYPFLTLEQLGGINEMYPNPNKTCPGIGCYWRQVSNVYQEVRYTCPALYITESQTRFGVNNSYAYLWNVEDPAQVAQGLGVPHTVEFNALLGSDYAKAPPDSYKPGQVNGGITPLMQHYWLNFIKTYSPNGKNSCNSKEVRWLPWSKSQARLIFQTGATAEMVKLDDGLRKRCDFWFEHGVSMRL